MFACGLITIYMLQLLSEVFILGCIDALPLYSGFMEGRRPETYLSVLGGALIQPKINIEGNICFLYLFLK